MRTIDEQIADLAVAENERIAASQVAHRANVIHSEAEQKCFLLRAELRKTIDDEVQRVAEDATQS